MFNEEIKVFYEDKHLIVCEKPVGIPSQPDLLGQRDLLTILSENYKEVKLVHRLDTMTGGVMVFAKNQNIASLLSADIQNHDKFIKEYIAVIDNIPKEKEGFLVDQLYHDKKINKSFVVDTARKGSKEAKLEYNVIEESEDGNALIKVRLFTGRSHQIRIQFASRKCPIYGDGKYGSKNKMTGFALWSYSLTFTHPVFKKVIKINSIPGKDNLPWSKFDLNLLGES